MTVNNAAPVIERCLRSVLPLIDYWVVVDTGSSDGTQDIVRCVMEEVPGELHERTGAGGAHHRTEALELARERADYSLIIDAEDLLECAPGFEAPVLTEDSYEIVVGERRRVGLVSNRLSWRFEGGARGCVVCEDVESSGLLSGVTLRRELDPRGDRFDAEALEDVLAGELSPFLRAKYTFYLAQAYRELGQAEQALQRYVERAKQGFWREEQYVSLYEAAKLMETLERPVDEVIATLQQATELCPWRAEAAHAASLLCRLRGLNQRGYELAEPLIALTTKPPPDGLYVQDWIYDYGFLDEFSINAYWFGRFNEALDACLRLLASPKLPERHRQRVASNARFSFDNLTRQRSADSGHGPSDAPEKKYLIVTPYYKEHRSVLERCLASVRRQTVRVDHLVVADGFPQEWLDDAGVRHLRLDRNHSDFGDTPRGVGAMIGVAEGYDGIGFLDADCWLELDHVESCLKTAAADRECDYVVARSVLRRPDESIMQIRAEPPEEHVDTNCSFLLPSAYAAIPTWAMIPQQTAVVGDRVFYLTLKGLGLRAALNTRASVNYTCLWASFYRVLGEKPPEGAKENPDHAAVQTWLDNLADDELGLLNERIRGRLELLYPLSRRGRAATAAAEVETGAQLVSVKAAESPQLSEARTLFRVGLYADADRAFDELRAEPSMATEADYYQGQIQRLRARPGALDRPVLTWRCNNDLHWEADWIRELLAEVPFVDRLKDGRDLTTSHMIVCDNRLTAQSAEFYRAAYKQGARIHLIHLSDERVEDDLSAYRWCESVFRNYYSPDLATDSKVSFFALGYKAGFTQGLVNRSADERAYMWSFAGHTRVPSRPAMLETMIQIDPHLTHLTGGFNDKNGLSTDEYRKLMQDSLFIPCPAGFCGIDTFRTSEALEAGCIPIVERRPNFDYYRMAYGDNPMPSVESWSEAPELIRAILKRNGQEALRKSCNEWWANYKRSVSGEFTRRITR
jgi:cellulose synthase/poly-beta-1,6-N-acetylglucosamine synthase-like glycosyltransferase